MGTGWVLQIASYPRFQVSHVGLAYPMPLSCANHWKSTCILLPFFISSSQSSWFYTPNSITKKQIIELSSLRHTFLLTIIWYIIMNQPKILYFFGAKNQLSWWYLSWSISVQLPHQGVEFLKFTSLLSDRRKKKKNPEIYVYVPLIHFFLCLPGQPFWSPSSAEYKMQCPGGKNAIKAIS